MKKRILTVAFAAAILFSGAMLFQVENAEAQDATPADTTPVDAFPKLGKWIKIYNGDMIYVYDECYAHTLDECRVGQRRPAQKPANAVPVGN